MPIVCHLVNLCFSNGIFPSLFKNTLVTPVYTSGTRNDINNYRPVSVLSPVSKIIDKLINTRLLNYLEKNNLLFQLLYGFRQGDSTKDAATALTTLVSHNFNYELKCLAIFLDLKKGIDPVSIPIPNM